MTHAASHIQENDVLGLCSPGVLLSEGITGQASSEHGSQAHSEITAGGIDHELAAAQFVGLMKLVKVHGIW